MENPCVLHHTDHWIRIYWFVFSTFKSYQHLKLFHMVHFLMAPFLLDCINLIIAWHFLKSHVWDKYREYPGFRGQHYSRQQLTTGRRSWITLWGGNHCLQYYLLLTWKWWWMYLIWQSACFCWGRGGLDTSCNSTQSNAIGFFMKFLDSQDEYDYHPLNETRQGTKMLGIR